jgi:hypothetical protein
MHFLRKYGWRHQATFKSLQTGYNPMIPSRLAVQLARAVKKIALLPAIKLLYYHDNVYLKSEQQKLRTHWIWAGKPKNEEQNAGYANSQGWEDDTRLTCCSIRPDAVGLGGLGLQTGVWVSHTGPRDRSVLQNSKRRRRLKFPIGKLG